MRHGLHDADTRAHPALPAAWAAAAVATAVALLGSGAFWLCVPGALAVAAVATSRLGAALGALTVVAAAAAPRLASAGLDGLPALPLVLLVPAASVIVLLAVRERLERDRDALRAFALTDPLTGIANRRALLSRIEYEVARHTRIGHSFALVMLDLDGFKLLNDRFGHPAGDDLLREVAAELTRAIRDQDTVARVGGDEFCVLAPETDRAGAQRLAGRAVGAVRRVTAGIDVLGASAGASLFPDDGASAAALLQAADQRLLGAKRQVHRAHPRRRAA